MRVLMVITKGELGGAQTHVVELCGALRHSHRFHVLIGGSEQSPLGQALGSLDIPTTSLPELSNAASVRSVLTSARRIASHARAWRADVIHVHSAVAAVVGRLAGCLARVPVVYTVHGFAFKPQVPRLRRFCAFAAERVLVPLTTHLICVCPAERQLAGQLGVNPERVSVISNGLSDTACLAHPAATPANLIMVARMAAPKRHDLLLQALQLLRGRGVTPPETMLIGGGPLLANWRERAQASALDCVRFCGDVSDVPERLARSQVFVLLSDHEGQPISVIEAMRAGVPIIASDLPGVRAQITDAVEGLLTPNAPGPIADRLQRLLGDPALRERMGAAARRRFEAEFSATRMADQVALVYERVGMHARLARPGVAARQSSSGNSQ
jgi:glycosyltransferase involved in cell wall biosynthesis